MTPVIGRPPSDDPPPRGPRRIWTGDWLSESERARRAAEEAAARLEMEVAARESERTPRDDPEGDDGDPYRADPYSRPQRSRPRRRRRLTLRAGVALAVL